MNRAATALLSLLLASAPALAQEHVPDGDCGACTELDRQTMANPVPPSDLPPPPQKRAAERGRQIEFQVPVTNDTITVWHRPGSGLWVSDLAPGGVYVQPKKDKFSLEMRF